MSGERLLRIAVSLKGRPIRTQAFQKEIVTVGRSPDADIFLDNPGVSREHMRLIATPHDTYMAVDLGSANGTLLNDAPLSKKELANNDVLRVGKFALWVTYESDRRTEAQVARASQTLNEGTTVFSTRQLEEMITNIRDAETKAAPAAATVAATGPAARIAQLKKQVRLPFLVVVLVLAAFALGSLAGVGAMLYLSP